MLAGRARVRFQHPQLPPAAEIERYFRLSRDARWFSNQGPCVRLLAERLATRVGPNLHCVPTASATLALMVALRALTETVAPTAREVLLPSFTFVATLSAVVWTGLEPVFVDVEGDHWHASPDALGDAVAARGGSIACLLPCSAFGTAPPASVRGRWEGLGREAGIPLLIDSAAGYGAADENDDPIGGQGDAEVFSYHVTKPFAVGEGGAVFTRHEGLAKRIGELANFGLSGDRSISGGPGLNAKMSEIHAATGLATLDRYDEVLAARRVVAAEVVRCLTPHGFRFQRNSSTSTWQFIPALAPDADARRRILSRAAARGVELRTYYEPLHLMPPLSRHATHGSLETTEDLGSRIISLPMANDLVEADIDLICGCVIEPEAGTR